jgi:hypothetical protein
MGFYNTNGKRWIDLRDESYLDLESILLLPEHLQLGFLGL